MSQSRRLSPSLGTAPWATLCRPRGRCWDLGCPWSVVPGIPAPPNAPSPQDELGLPRSLQGGGGAGEGSVLLHPLGVRFQRCLCQVLLTGSSRAGPCCWRGRWWHRCGPACTEQSRGGTPTCGSRPHLLRVMLGSGEARIPCSHPAGCWGSCRAPGSRCSGWRGAVPRCFAQDEPAVAMTTQSHPLPRFLLKSCPHRHRQLLALRLRLGAGQGCGGAWAMPLLVRAKGPGWHAPVAPWLARLCRCIGDVLGHPKAFWGIPSTTAMP